MKQHGSAKLRSPFKHQAFKFEDWFCHQHKTQTCTNAKSDFIHMLCVRTSCCILFWWHLLWWHWNQCWFRLRLKNINFKRPHKAKWRQASVMRVGWAILGSHVNNFVSYDRIVTAYCMIRSWHGYLLCIVYWIVIFIEQPITVVDLALNPNSTSTRAWNKQHSHSMYSLASDVIQLQQSKSEYLKRDSANESHDLKRDSANKRQLAKSRNDMLVQQKNKLPSNHSHFSLLFKCQFSFQCC